MTFLAVAIIGTLLKPVSGVAQSTTTTTSTQTTPDTDSTAAKLDQAVAAHAQGDKATTVKALQEASTALENEAKSTNTSFKNKLTTGAEGLKSLIPLAETGLVKGNLLTKAISIAKLALGGSQLETLLGGSELTGKTSGLTSSLNLLKTGLSALGGSKQSAGQSLITKALSSVSKLDTGGATAEPAARKQLGSVLDLVKGVL